MPGVWYPAQKNPAIPATNQWQGGTIYPDGIERVGIRANVHPLMETNSLFVEMDASLQFCASPFGSWQKTSSFMPKRRVNNVLILYS